jgi:hypothetical protein
MTNKTIADFFEVYRPKSPDEQKFVDKHVVIKHKDRNGNGDDVFNAKNVKKADRKKERHGYEPGDDEKVYEEVEQVDELSDGLKARYTRAASADRDDVSQRLSSGQDGDHRFIKPGGKKETAFKRIVKNREAGIQRANEEVDQSDDNHSGTYEYQHRSGRYVKAKITGHPKTGYKIRWADGSTSYKPNNDELKKTIKSGGLIFNEEVEALDEQSFHHYVIQPIFGNGAPSGTEGGIDHVKGAPAKMRRHGIVGGEVAGHYGKTKYIKVSDTKTGLTSNHSVYQSDHNPKTGETLLSVRPKGGTGAHLARHNKALAAYLSGKRKLSEDFESLEEMRGRSYATVKPGYYHRGPTTNKPLDDDLRKGLNAIDTALKKAKGYSGTPKKPVAEDVESIDELSKPTLARYVKKATEPKNAMKDVEKKHDNARKDTKAYKRMQGYGMPDGEDGGVNRAAKRSETEADRTKYSAGMRKKYVQKAIDKLAEDVEQIDEIGNTKAGRQALGSYINKRAADIGTRAYEAGKSISWDADDAAYKKELKHRAGIERAVSKLAAPRKFRRYYGEELAGSFVDKYMPEQADMPAPTNEEKLVSVLMDQNIAEAIAADVLALHSTLDEQNQRLLIDNIMEGRIDEVVDFAIQNRN